MTRAQAALAAAALGLCLPLAGCGGDGGSGGSSGTPDATAAAVPASAGDSSNDFIAYLKALIALGPNETGEPKDLGALRAPPADETSEPQPAS